MDAITMKYKTLLKKCLEREISLDIIQQIINLRSFPKAEQMVDKLMNQINNITEAQLKKLIAQLIEEN